MRTRILWISAFIPWAYLAGALQSLVIVHDPGRPGWGRGEPSPYVRNHEFLYINGPAAIDLSVPVAAHPVT